MRAGRMRAELTLQTRDISTSSYGAGDVAWRAIAEMRGFIQAAGGSSREVGDSVQDESLMTITVRYGSQITPLMRLYESETGRTFEIIQVNNDDDRDHVIILSCRELPI